MKKNIISGGGAVIFGLLIALGPQFLFKICESHGDNILRCFWMARVELCVGILIAALGICLIVFSDQKTQLGITISLFLTGLFAGIIPMDQFIGICKDAEAICRKVTVPALLIICVLLVIGAVINIIYLERKTKT